MVGVIVVGVVVEVVKMALFVEMVGGNLRSSR